VKKNKSELVEKYKKIYSGIEVIGTEMKRKQEIFVEKIKLNAKYIFIIKYLD